MNQKVGKEIIGFTVRKFTVKNGKKTSPSKLSLEYQMKTLHKKIKREDETLSTSYSIEKDETGTGYHIHLIFRYTDFENLRNKIKKYIGGSNWTKDTTSTKNYLCIGNFGIAYQHLVYSDNFLPYMDKYNPVINLW